MDVLGDVLRTLALDSELYFRATFRGPFGMEVPAEACRIRFHRVTAGRCWIGLAGQAPVAAGAGDLVLVPHGAAHGVAHAPDAPLRALADVVASAESPRPGEIVCGAGDPEVRLVCGHFSYRSARRGADAARADTDSLHPLLQRLPPLLQLRAGEARGYAWVDSLLDHLGRESRDGRAGAGAIVRRLSEIVLIEVLRAYLERGGSHAALTALADPVVRRALEAIHAEPERAWSLGGLAARAGASRSVLAERFRDALGTSPMRYATRWRLERARLLLDHRELSIGEIAATVGYASEAAFNRAFKDAYGEPPGRLRASLQDGRASNG